MNNKKIFTLILLLFPIQLHPGVSANIFDVHQLVEQAEKENNLPSGLIEAMIHVESNYDKKAFVKSDGWSKKSSYGLLQVQLDAARTVHFKGRAKELRKPDVNIKYGAAYFSYLLSLKHGDYAKALTCYNTAPWKPICRSKDKKYSSYVGLVLNAWIKNKINE